MTKNYPQLLDKLNLIFWPYLRLTFYLLAGYGLLDGALLHWLPGFDPPAEFWRFLGPGVIATVFVLWLLWPRLRLLGKYKSKGQDTICITLSMMAVATIALGTNYLHEYLRASLGRLEILDSPAALIGSHSQGTYYRFRHKYQTARYARVEWQSTTTDKGRTLVFHLYVVTPLFASPADTGQSVVSWQGLHYRAEINTNASEAEKNAAYQTFLKRTMTEFGAERFSAPAGYYERIPNTSERAAYLRAARRIGRHLPDASFSPLLLQPAQASLAALQCSALYSLASWLSMGTLLFFSLMLFPHLSATSAQAFRTKHP